MERGVARTKFEEIQDAIRTYGQAAFQNLLRCKALGEAVIEGLHKYLGCDQRNVSAVPPEGPFDSRRDYGEEAFSFHNRQIIILEPVRFGVSVIVGNAEDSGALWLRTLVSAEVAGDAFEVYVGAQPVIRTPLDFEGSLDPIFEAIVQEFLDTFEVDVMEFNDVRFKSKIGFMPN
jgi:hypothetical protein